jgi:cellulose synthase/poly-beta-1,6-N-acetylglucosamine synthase-like glycosyltransferase
MESLLLTIYFIALTILFGFGIHGIVLLYYYRKTKLQDTQEVEQKGDWPLVTIQLPMFNELYVVERLIGSICEIDYPKDKLEIQVLDDSTDETQALAKKLCLEYEAKGFDISYIHRVDRTGYKAGALKEGLKIAKGEFVAIFDADFVPKKDFLKRTVPHFQNEKVGMVQTRWEHINGDESYLTKAQAIALDGHFVIEQQVRNKAGFFINFNGTAGIWRKDCILDAGNWQADTLTEDFDLSYRAQLNGWKFKFLNDVTSPAELPADINALKTQQFRWTKGAVETALKLLPMVWKSKLKPKVKLECFIHLTSNIVFPFIILVAMLNIPIVMIKISTTGYDSVYSLMSIFVLASISTFLFYMYGQKAIHLDWRKRILLFPVFLAGSMGLAVNNTKAVLEALVGKKTEFTRTPKDGDKAPKNTIKKKYRQNRVTLLVAVELLLTLYFVVGIGYSLYHLEIAAIPFQILFLLGFGTVGLMSLRHALGR